MIQKEETNLTDIEETNEEINNKGYFDIIKVHELIFKENEGSDEETT